MARGMIVQMTNWFKFKKNGFNHVIAFIIDIFGNWLLPTDSWSVTFSLIWLIDPFCC